MTLECDLLEVFVSLVDLNFEKVDCRRGFGICSVSSHLAVIVPPGFKCAHLFDWFRRFNRFGAFSPIQTDCDLRSWLALSFPVEFFGDFQNPWFDEDISVDVDCFVNANNAGSLRLFLFLFSRRFRTLSTVLLR